jgi:hypothetical protein
MKKYKIEVSGKGAEAHVFNLTDDQKQKLLEGDVMDDGMSVDEIYEVLGVDDFLDSDETLIGLYPNPYLVGVSVYNENDDKVWESDENLNLQTEDVEYKYDNPNTLIIEDYIKGTPIIYEVEIEELFDPKHLEPVIISVAETVELVVGFKYNNVDLSPFRDYGDYWSKGLSFYLY